MVADVFPQHKPQKLGVLLLYALAQYVFIVALLQFNWRRYYFPTLFAMKLLAAVGVVVPVLLPIQYWRTRGAGTGSIEAPQAPGEDPGKPVDD